MRCDLKGAPCGVVAMAPSVFETRKLDDIYEEIRTVYLSDTRPWILGFSGGKDSTCMVQLIWKALASLPKSKLKKAVYIISSDTLVESPKIVEQITTSLDMMGKAGIKDRLPISTNLVRPKFEDSFWTCLLGKGFPAPTNMFRWCTDRLKVRNADRFIQEKVSQYGEAIIVLGTRKNESGSRNQLMSLYEIEGSLLSRHSKLAQTYVYTPLRDFITEDVWNYLLQNKNPWGANNRDLLALYQNANSAECPLVVDSTTPSCGNSRFGCWVCTVVDNDSSLANTIENGCEWMEPLLELRETLKSTQDPKKRRDVREFRRRDGQMRLIDHVQRRSIDDERSKSMSVDDVIRTGNPYDILTPGPYTMEFRMEFLEQLLIAQEKIRNTGPDPNISLIHEEEIRAIQKLWRMECGDWQNSAYRIYADVTGILISDDKDDLGAFGVLEQETLESSCSEHGVSSLLVSRLLNAELDSQGMTRHSAIYPKLNKILSEEWRDDLNEIVDDLKIRKQQRQDYGGVSIC